MKILKTVFLAVLTISVLFVACTKDEDGDPPKNQMTIDVTEYSLDKGILENYGQDQPDEGFNIDLTLFSSGFTLYEVNGEVDSISGVG